MSNAVSALNHAQSEGFAKLAELGLRGMITLRGDLGSKPLRAGVAKATGIDVPSQRGCNLDGDRAVAWMSPDELLIMVPYAEVGSVVSTLEKALAGQHALVANVSDARAVFRIEGPRAREVIAKLAPVDMSPDGFTKGQIRRTRLAQVSVAFWASGEGAFELICFRSVAGYVFELLSSAAQPGSQVDYF